MMILPLAFKFPQRSIHLFLRQGSPQTSEVVSTLGAVLSVHNLVMFPRALLLLRHLSIMQPHLHHMSMQPRPLLLQPHLQFLQPNLQQQSLQPNLHRQRMQPILQQDLQPQHLHQATQASFLQLDDQR